MLASYFVDRFCRELKRSPLMLSSEALDALQHYAWPGNVRELQNCIERAVILADGDVIGPRQLNLVPQVPAASAGVPPDDPWARIDLSGTLADASQRMLREVERRKLAQALADTGGDRTRMCEMLQLTPKALASRLREYGLA